MCISNTAVQVKSLGSISKYKYVVPAAAVYHIFGDTLFCEIHAVCLRPKYFFPVLLQSQDHTFFSSGSISWQQVKLPDHLSNKNKGYKSDAMLGKRISLGHNGSWTEISCVWQSRLGTTTCLEMSLSNNCQKMPVNFSGPFLNRLK